MKGFSRIISSAAASAMLMQCGCAQSQVITSQKEQTEITLSWWGNDARNEYTLQAVELFQQKYPDIKVKCSYSEWSGYEARSRIRMVSDTEADVMQINVGWLSEYSADGSGYYDLSKVSDIIDLTSFPENTLKYGTQNGVLNAIPIAMNTETIYINKTVYDKYGLDIPKTWDDIFSAAEVLSKDGIYPLSGPDKAIWLFSVAYAEQTGGNTFFNDRSEITFTADDLQLMIEFYVKIVRENVIPQVEDFKKVNYDNGSYAGAVAWVSDAINYFGGSIEKGDNVIPADYIAYSDLESGDGWYEKPATLYAMSKNTVHPKESAMLLNFLLNEREMALLQGVEKGIPISSSALKYLDEEGMLSGLQYDASVVMSNNDRLREMDPLIENTDLIEAFIAACNLVLYDKASAEEAAEQLYETYSASYKMG